MSAHLTREPARGTSTRSGDASVVAVGHESRSHRQSHISELFGRRTANALVRPSEQSHRPAPIAPAHPSSPPVRTLRSHGDGTGLSFVTSGCRMVNVRTPLPTHFRACTSPGCGPRSDPGIPHSRQMITIDAVHPRRRVGIKATGPNKSSRSPHLARGAVQIGDDPRRQLFDEIRSQLGLARSRGAADRYDTSVFQILTRVADGRDPASDDGSRPMSNAGGRRHAGA